MQKMARFEHEKHRDDHSRNRHGMGPRGLARGLAGQGRLTVLAALALTACTTTPEPQIVVKEVRVPVAVPCPIDTSEPVYVDGIDALKAAASKGADAVVALFIGGRTQRDAVIAGLKAQAGECANP